ncbi:DUF262 domain-containing protein [Heliobacillus mobilis]|uniref:DUF262 domain-containing protein n=1 Tax=Heliobacterium mobile TaxID=28064 RepID=A0A6I3SQ18_HELMO|nr:DUF262 domain-containing protein [Heliobacterium mobile]MTV50522.1 DUF262 domain-containing protein [Heliobacterium mobile]
MSGKGEIKSEKILIKDIFSHMWFRIPEYQRPYVWGADEVVELLDDLTYAMMEKPDSEYFLGSFVFQAKAANPAMGQAFDENDLLDGQQRMTTLLLLFAVIRDLADDPDAKDDCQKCIYQKSSKYKNIPERTRLVYAIRDSAQAFIENYIKTTGGTAKEADLTKCGEKDEDLSAQNMAKAVLRLRKFFQENPAHKPEELLQFLLNRVLLIYVSTEDLDDAFRLFTILNDRGIPLRNSDILKSLNLGALTTSAEKAKYARLWEEAEGELGEDFDRFLNHVRTVLVKEKARLNLLQEYEDKIYDPKERDKATGQRKPVLLRKGRETFELIERYLSHYRTLLGGQNYDETGQSFAFDNLVKVMQTGLPATDWMPPLLRYYNKFGYSNLLVFLQKLDNKFSADWIGQYAPTDRIEAMNRVLKVIDDAASEQDVFNSGCFDIDRDAFVRVLDGPVYGRRFAKYILLKLDYLYQNHDQRMHFETLSVEHVLPQNPDGASQWVKDFTPSEREEWVNRLGNLVLITRRKNTSQGRMDYLDKKKRYFDKCIDTCPNSLRVLRTYDRWTPAELLQNHRVVLNAVLKHYGV